MYKLIYNIIHNIILLYYLLLKLFIALYYHKLKVNIAGYVNELNYNIVKPISSASSRLLIARDGYGQIMLKLSLSFFWYFYVVISGLFSCLKGTKLDLFFI